jgi:hypothetical protein
MDSHEMPMAPHHRVVTDRFIAACQADERVVAATLYGSYARGPEGSPADAYSDLDLGLITTDEAYEDFCAGREAFVRQLGEVLFLEDFGSTVTLFFILANGAEGELSLGREGQFLHDHGGAYKVLLDKKNILTDATFPRNQPAPAEQVETLRRLVYWFWHDLSHFITGMGRGQLWWAQGQLEELRRICINLAHLRHDFSAEPQGYEKIELTLPIEQLASLQATFCPLEREAMLQAGLALVRFFQETAPPLAQAHAIAYPAALERIMLDRLDQLRDSRMQ